MKEEFEAIAGGLIGHSISHVRYFELFYEQHQSDFSKQTRFDSLDFGVELQLSSEEIYGLIWGSEFVQYGVSLLPKSLREEVSNAYIKEVANEPNWKELIGVRISDAHWMWNTCEIYENDTREEKLIDYPQSLIIKFSSGERVVVSAIEIRGDRSYDMIDHITVFFDDDAAVTYGALQAQA